MTSSSLCVENVHVHITSGRPTALHIYVHGTYVHITSGRHTALYIYVQLVFLAFGISIR